MLVAVIAFAYWRRRHRKGGNIQASSKPLAWGASASGRRGDASGGKRVELAPAKALLWSNPMTQASVRDVEAVGELPIFHRSESTQRSTLKPAADQTADTSKLVFASRNVRRDWLQSGSRARDIAAAPPAPVPGTVSTAEEQGEEKQGRRESVI
jgi:hypothetical protein